MVPKQDFILVVDDSSVNNLLMQNILEEEGYTILTVESGKEALSMIRQKSPVLVILDIMMPDLDGFEVLENLKTEDKTMNIPVMMLTARNNSRDKQKALALGALDYIIKPIDIPDVIARIKRILKVS
ncbi:MAG: PleD family two-component system response regulator [Bacteroidales bacterium]